ncbi:MAG TPA: 50S ribosomal protein L9 [Clostridia bacterium]|nr:50S ribosomal protein L9 [Clostridia bacterium]
MKVILKEDIKGLGKEGDVANVSDGYARNYLIPKGLAVAATSGNIRSLKQLKKTAEKKQEKAIDAAQKLVQKLEGLTVVVNAKVGETGRLFGSVNNKDIAEILRKKHKIKVDRKKIVLRDPIKELGNYTLTVKLHPKVNTKLNVEVTGE